MSRISGLKARGRVEMALVIGSFTVYHRVVAGSSSKRGGSVTEEAIPRIRDRITSGVWGPGTKLPREVDLAADVGLSRSSLREAVRALALVRVLQVRQGDGT